MVLHEKEGKVNLSLKIFWCFNVKNNLEILRKNKEISQEELGNILEVSRQTISSLENGRYNPSIILAFRIARFFEMSIEEIFIYQGE